MVLLPFLLLVQSIPFMATRRDTRSLDHEAGMADLGLDEEDAVVSAPVRSAPAVLLSLNCGMMPAVFPSPVIVNFSKSAC